MLMSNFSQIWRLVRYSPEGTIGGGFDLFRVVFGLRDAAGADAVIRV
jgi:hypothetical protein